MILAFLLGALGRRGRVAIPGGADPNFASVGALLHFEGADASTTFTDQKGKTFTAVGNAQIDTAQFKFGSASGLFDGTGDSITTPTHSDFVFGTGDFTLEGWVRFNTVTGGLGHDICTKRATNGNFGPFLLYQVDGQIQFFLSSTGSSWNIASSAVIASSRVVNTWYHVALCRSGNSFLSFCDGVAGATASSALSLFANATALSIGGAADGSNGFNGWIDDFRITKGVARYTTGFTPPIAAFPDF